MGRRTVLIAAVAAAAVLALSPPAWAAKFMDDLLSRCGDELMCAKDLCAEHLRTGHLRAEEVSAAYLPAQDLLCGDHVCTGHLCTGHVCTSYLSAGHLCSRGRAGLCRAARDARSGAC